MRGKKQAWRRKPAQIAPEAGKGWQFVFNLRPGFWEQATHDPPQGFSLGQLTLHLASALTPRVTFFGELSFTARSDAGTGSPSATGFNTEVERLIRRFDQSDRLNSTGGALGGRSRQ